MANSESGLAEQLTEISASQQTYSVLQLSAPERIWLQVSDAQIDAEKPFPERWNESTQPTWCDESVMPAEVAYVRADLASPAPEPIKLPINPHDFERGYFSAVGRLLQDGLRNEAERLFALCGNPEYADNADLILFREHGLLPSPEPVEPA